MARYKILLLVIITSSLSLYVFTQSFVVKKQKRVSPTVLKQDIGQLLGELLQLSAAQIKSLAHMQEGIIEKTYELLEQDSESFFAKVDTAKLQKCYEQLDEMLKKMRGSYKEQRDSFEKLHDMFCLPRSGGKAV